MATTEPAQPGAQQTMERLLRLLVQKNGSDLYISAHAQPTMRLHGLCVPASSRALGSQDPVQLLAVLIGEQSAKALRPPQTLQRMVSLQDSGRLRINVFFQRGALAFSARYLPATLPSIGHGQGQLSPALHALAKSSSGLLLIAGAAGAGKTTTAAALLECRNSEISGHILALEENAEYLLTSKKSLINQQQIGADVASWHSAFELAQRCAADVVLISEINDEASANAALSLAQSGVLCIATINARTAADALLRFVQFFSEGERAGVQTQLGNALLAVVLQKLMRTKAGPRVAVCEILAASAQVAALLEPGAFNALRSLDLSQAAGSQSQTQEMLRMQQNGLSFEDPIPEPANSAGPVSWGNGAFAEAGDSVRATGLGQASNSGTTTPITLSL
jgi:twitching motility protein PilU